MAYSTDNQPSLLSSGIGGAFQLWFYKSTDAATLVRASGYFTDGYELGMRAGDIVLQVDTDAAPIASQIMIVSSAVAGTVDLSDGTAITATDTD
ncbi:hypothetical protein [Profundibacter sp.]